MSESTNIAWEELERLIDGACDQSLSADELASLSVILAEDPQACDHYIAYTAIHRELAWQMTQGVRFSPAELERYAEADRDFLEAEAEGDRLGEVLTPPVSAAGFFSNAFYGSIGFFSQEVPFAMLIATLVTGVGLLAGSMVYVTHHKQLADNKPRPRPSSTTSEIEFIGRVTGIIDVQWADIQTATVAGAKVPLGRKYALSSGLMEIVYDGGARVVLQGPCTYEVDSRAGGFLARGRLTAKLEERGEGRGESREKVASGQWPVVSETNLPSPASGRGAGGEGGLQSEKVASGQWLVASESDPKSRNPKIFKSQISNPQSLIPNPSLAPLFTIKTPTATVVDLGTEFVVEVQPDRSTMVHVIRGLVEASRDDRTGGSPVCERLAAGEAIRFGTIDQSPRRVRGQVAHVTIPPDLRAAVRQTNQARTSRLLLMPTGLVASAYHQVWNAKGKLVGDNDRQLAFHVATDGLFGRGEKNAAMSSFDTREGAGGRDQGSGALQDTAFVGLLYGRAMRFDRIKVFLGRQKGDGGNWASMPKVFILKKPGDTDRVRPESDPANWRELRLDQMFYGNAFDAKADANPGAVLEFLLTSFSEEQRTGYGWALGGAPGDGSDGYVSVTELRGYGIEVQQPNKESQKGGSESREADGPVRK